MRLTLTPIVAVALTLANSAQASVFDLYGMGARGIAFAGAMTAAVDDFTATFYNPAALTKHSDVRDGGNYLLTVPRLYVNRGLPVCLQSEAVCRGAYGGAYSSREARLPDSFSGFTLGWSIPFDLGIGRLGTGVALYVPSINLIRAEGIDPVTPQFYQYQNLPDQLVILVSAAWAPVPWFSFGGGIQVLADVGGTAEFELDVANGAFDRSDISVEIVPKVAATAGLLFRPARGLDIGLSYRQELGLEFALPTRVDAGGILVIGLDTGGSVLYTPHQIQFGASYRIAPAKLTVAAELDYAFWEKAPDPSPRVGVTVGGKLVDAVGLEGSLDIDGDKSVSLGFHDTVTSRVALEWEALSWLDVRAGYAFRPSPAPKATGAYNYLDNDVHTIGFGLGFTFLDPLSVHDRPIGVSLGTQIGVLPKRTVVKASRNDPVGDLEHGGVLYSFSLSISHSY